MLRRGWPSSIGIQRYWLKARINFSRVWGRFWDKSTGFMHWSSFISHDLPMIPDIMEDRLKSLIACFSALDFSISFYGVTITVKGLFEVLVRMLNRQDIRTYYKSTKRKLLLPDSASQKPDELELVRQEKDLFGTNKYNGPCSMMTTCLWYSDYKVGTITLFKVEMTETDGGDWPERISPVAAMEGVPKAVLKLTAGSVGSSKKMKLEVKTKSDPPLRWVSKNEPRLEQNSKGLSRKISRNMREALAIDAKKMKVENSTKVANMVMATIPQMLAWLHVKASLVENVEMIQRMEKDEVQRMVTWKKRPTGRDHEGKNPHIVVLCSDADDWATEPIHWGSG